MTKLPVGRVTSLIVKGVEKNQEQRSWEMWMSLYPHMIIPQPSMDKPRIEFKPFSEFYRASITTSGPLKTKEEILDDVDSIIAMARSPKE